MAKNPFTGQDDAPPPKQGDTRMGAMGPEKFYGNSGFMGAGEWHSNAPASRGGGGGGFFGGGGGLLGTSITLPDVINAATNFYTLGTVGYQGGANAGFTQGIYAHAGMEGLGEITGRNLARRANNEAEYKAILAQEAQQQDLKNQQALYKQKDIQSSNGVQAIRDTAQAATNPNAKFQSTRNPNTTDFLGL